MESDTMLRQQPVAPDRGDADLHQRLRTMWAAVAQAPLVAGLSCALVVVRFELGEMGQQFGFGGPTHEKIAQHLVRAPRRFAAGPEADQQAGNDRAVGLDLDPARIVAQQMPAAQQVFEGPEEDFNLPAMEV